MDTTNTVAMTHPATGHTTTVPASSVAHHQRAGWALRKELRAAPRAAASAPDAGPDNHTDTTEGSEAEPESET